MTLMGFECVVRALRSGYKVRRPSWKPGVHIYYDHAITKQILFQEDKGTSFYTANTEDIMAEDWERYLDK